MEYLFIVHKFYSDAYNRYGEGEIQEKVATFRMMLLEKDVAVVKEGEQQQKSR